MASLYTDNLNIEKPADGEQEGVWGNTVNLNMDKLDGRTCRVYGHNIAAAGLTLQSSQGALGSFDSQVIRCSGTLGADRTITFPAKQGRFTLDLSEVGFSTFKITAANSGDNGVTCSLQSNEKIFDIYTNGVSVRRIAAELAPAIRGEIKMYYPASAGFTLPTGWRVCNGSNGTPDLRNKFVRGHSTMSGVQTSTGGSDTKSISIPNGSFSGTTGGTALTAAMIPNHHHLIAAIGSGVGVGAASNLNSFQFLTADGTGSTDRAYALTATATSANAGRTSNNVGGGTATHTHSFSGTTSHSNASTDVKPAYHSLIFIMYTGS